MRNLKFSNFFLCQIYINVLLQVLQDIAASTNNSGTININSTENNNSTLSWNLVGVDASVDAISIVSPTTSNSYSVIIDFVLMNRDSACSQAERL